MGNRFASAKNSIAICDRCGFQYKLKELKKLIIKTKQVNIMVCPECWEPDQPQLQLGMYPVYDPQAVRDPRKDTSYVTSGNSGLQLSPSDVGTPEGGSRIIEWGWAPVGGARANDDGLTPNVLEMAISVGDVSVALNTVPLCAVNTALMPNALLLAGINTQPQKTLFKDTLVNGRPLGDITNNGTVGSDDALAYTRFNNGTLTSQAQISYITGTLNPYMQANQTTYAAYLNC